MKIHILDQSSEFENIDLKAHQGGLSMIFSHPNHPGAEVSIDFTPNEANALFDGMSQLFVACEDLYDGTEHPVH